MKKLAVLFALLTFAACAEDALTPEQTTQLQSLVQKTQAEQSRLKSALAESQEKLAQCYDTFEVNDTRVAELQKEIGKLQQDMLTSHNAMQKELRTVVGAEQFKTLSKRMVGALRIAPPPPAPNKDTPAAAEERVYSGPQVGEALKPFKLRGVFDDNAGKELDFVTQANGAPIVLIFVHDLNRQSIGMTRILSTYTAGRAKDGLKTGVVWLDDDATAAEESLKRVRHALAKDAPVGISADGREGPGSYGLNRKVMLTILVGKDNKVTANYALIQPSLQADLPKILDSIVAVAGGKAPKLEELEGMPAMAQSRPAAGAEEKPDMRPLLLPVIRKNAEPEDVEKAAKTVEDAIEKSDAVRKEIARISTTLVNGGHLDNYGTPKAQEIIRKWAEKYGAKKEEKKEPQK